MVTSPGATYTNDILGNRLTKGSATYGWDCLNRMVSYMNGTANETYGYRADGMRTFKSNSGSTTVYRYDGQMLSRRRNPARRGNELGLPCESGGMEDVDITAVITTFSGEAAERDMPGSGEAATALISANAYSLFAIGYTICAFNGS